MPYISLATGIPEIYQLRQLRTDHPNVSFPKDIPDSVLADYNVYPYTIADVPAVDALTQTLTAGVIAQVDGQWVQSWDVNNMHPEQAASNVRNRRNELLAETDWVVTKAVDQNAQDNLGIQIPQVWLDYRQALRDVTDQAGFPYNVVWPTKP